MNEEKTTQLQRPVGDLRYGNIGIIRVPDGASELV